MRAVWWWMVVGVVAVVAVSGCSGGGDDAGGVVGEDSGRVGTRTVLRADDGGAVVEAVTVGDAATATLTLGSELVAEEIRVGARYFARVRGAEDVLGFERWISFDLTDRAEAATARRIGPGLLELVENGSFDGDVTRRTLARPPVIEPPPDGAHVPIGAVPDVVSGRCRGSVPCRRPHG